MKIQAVQDRTFQAKQRFLSLEAKKNMQALLHKMNNETVMDCTETTFSSKMLTGIKINKDSAFLREILTIIFPKWDVFL